MSEKNKEIIKQVNSAFLENKFERILDFCAEDVEWTFVGDKSFKGREKIGE